MPNAIQSGEANRIWVCTCRRYSMDGGKDGAPHICYATFNRWNDEPNVNVNRNDNGWNDNWSFGGVPKLSSFLAPLRRSRVF